MSALSGCPTVRTGDATVCLCVKDVPETQWQGRALGVNLARPGHASTGVKVKG